MAQREGCGREPADGLERSQRGEREHCERNAADGAGPDGRDPGDEDDPQRKSGGERSQPGPDPRGGRRTAAQRGEFLVGGADPVEPGLLGTERVHVRGARQQVAQRGSKLASGGSSPLPGPAVGCRTDDRHGHAGDDEPDRQQAGRGSEDNQARGHRGRADQRGRQRWGDAANEHLLGRVDVADQPGE
jgi:hypothetical protein